MKRDVPSGTALTLADSVNEGVKVKKKNSYRLQSTNLLRKKNEIGFSSLRGGDVVGEHSVYFFMDGERIELTHRAVDRKIFSNGISQIIYSAAAYKVDKDTHSPAPTR